MEAIYRICMGCLTAVGQRLRELRESRGLSQERLGNLVALAGPTISRYESGNTQINADDLPSLASALGVHPCDFFESDDDDAIPAGPRGVRMLDDILAQRMGLAPHEVQAVVTIVEAMARRS